MYKTHAVFQIGLFFLSLFSGACLGHDFWLEAHPFYTQINKTVDLSIHVGNEFSGDSLPNIASWYNDFSLYDKHQKTDIQGELGRDPAGYFIPQKQGTHIVGYQSTFTYIEFDPETFNKYLEEEGLQNAIDYRRINNQQNSMAKEHYIRHAKTLIQAGDTFDLDNSSLRLGYDLEIIPLQNPYQKNINETLDVQVLYQGQPENDVLLIAFSKQRPEDMQRIRSQVNGQVRIKLDQAGPWLLKAVKMLKLEGKKAQWESHWASLTFSMPEQ